MPLRQLYPDPNAKSTASNASNAARVDIIAVHGLNPRSKNDRDHAWDTWRKPSGPQGHLWLRDDLPQHVPETRIFLYEYNSTAVYGKDRDTFIGKANELLEAIRIERENIESRPIILLGHSMGGLLIKQALINAHNNPKYTPIKDATTGLAFFATPHHGGDWMLVSLGGVVAKIAMAMGFQKGDNVLETLKNGSIFSDIMQEHWRHQLLKYNIISFWGALDNIVPPESTRFGMPGDHENVVKLNADHSGVCKFGSTLEDQDNLKLAQSNIRDLYKEALRKNATSSRIDASNTYIPSYPLNSIAPAKTFVQRLSLREKIREQLYRQPDDERTREPKKVGVWGLGGAGKSQLALSYLQRYSGDYKATFWIQAGQTASIDRDCLEIYQSLPQNTLLQSYQTAPEDVRRAVLNWFTRNPGKWLIIFDGADQLHKSDQNFVDLSRYIPGCPNVHIIITSRSTTAQKFSTFEGVNVGELEEPQAVELFLKCAEIPSTETKTEADVKAIVKELGFLALAIKIAGAYVSQTPRLSSDLPAYLEEYRQRRQELLAEQPDDITNEYSHSVMTVWETSYTAVYDQLPEACRVLTLLAFINYEDIFLDLFGLESHTSSFQTQVSWTSVVSTESLVTMNSFEKCFAILERYSLLQRQTDQSSYSMHKLVHAWDHDRLQQENRSDVERFCLAAVQVLFEAVSNCKGLPQAKLRLVPHLRENFDAIRRLETDTVSENIDFINKLECIAHFTSEIGRWDEAAVVQKEVLKKRQQILGDKHPDTLKAINSLALTLRHQGKFDEAAAMQRDVLEKRQQILGNEHLDTLSAINNLANTFRDQGKLNKAAAMQREVLEKRQQILGDEHPDTLSAINNLAKTHKVQGKLDEAAAMQTQVLEKRQQILDNKHPDMLSALNNLANTLRDQGKLDKAAALQREVLEKRQQILGNKHPDMLKAMNNLANTLRHQGKFDEAAAMQRDVLEKRQQILGNKHPETLSSINNLANTLKDQGKFDEAAAMQREVLEKRRQILGDEHPDKLKAINNLANTLRAQGKLDEAAAMQKEVLKKRQQILGDKHPDILRAMNNLANTLKVQGKLDEAAAMQREVLEKRQQVLGNEHPDTLSAMNNLANTLRDQSKLDKGKLDEAAAMQKEVLEKRQQILGEKHPDTLSAINNLANTLKVQGKLDEAAAMQREVLEKRQQVLGNEHPGTLSAMNNLANTLRDQSKLDKGKLDEAAAMQRKVLEKRQQILGEKHPDTLSAINNLANTLKVQGKLNEAVVIQREVLEKRQQVLGNEHPDTLSAINNLANTLRAQGKLDEAAAMQREVLEKRQQILGEKHPDTLSAINNLANTLGDQGKLNEAAQSQCEKQTKRRRCSWKCWR